MASDFCDSARTNLSGSTAVASSASAESSDQHGSFGGLHTGYLRNDRPVDRGTRKEAQGRDGRLLVGERRAGDGE